jgi:hypothetical protein
MGNQQMTGLATDPRRLGDFEGLWQLERQIVHQDGTQAWFSGQASWTPAEWGLLYEETGNLRIADRTPVRAEQRYRWLHDLSVAFQDGRFFHAVPATGGDTSHWCDPDQYRGTYDFSRWPEFRVDWHVSGPRKAYRMHSIYTRLSVRQV